MANTFLLIFCMLPFLACSKVYYNLNTFERLQHYLSIDVLVHSFTSTPFKHMFMKIFSNTAVEYLQLFLISQGPPWSSTNNCATSRWKIRSQASVLCLCRAGAYTITATSLPPIATLQRRVQFLYNLLCRFCPTFTQLKIFIIAEDAEISVIEHLNISQHEKEYTLFIRPIVKNVNERSVL